MILAVGARHEEGVGCVLFEVQQRETPGKYCYNDTGIIVIIIFGTHEDYHHNQYIYES